MGEPIPAEYVDLLERRTFAHLATVMSDGYPQVSPVWIDYDGEYILVNSAKGRQKDLNMRRAPHVALSIIDPDDPYRKLIIRGIVYEVTEEGAREHIDRLEQKYRGRDSFPVPEGQVRVLYKIEPLHVSGGRA